MPTQLKASELKVHVFPTTAGLAAATDLHLLGSEHPAWLRAHTHLIGACFYWHLRSALMEGLRAAAADAASSSNKQRQQVGSEW
jgi:hypothetical protein